MSDEVKPMDVRVSIDGMYRKCRLGAKVNWPDAGRPESYYVTVMEGDLAGITLCVPTGRLADFSRVGVNPVSTQKVSGSAAAV